MRLINKKIKYGYLKTHVVGNQYNDVFYGIKIRGLKTIKIEKFISDIKTNYQIIKMDLLFKYEKIRQDFITKYFKDIKENEILKEIKYSYLKNYRNLERNTGGINTIYSIIDEFTWKKLIELESVFIDSYNKKVKNLNIIKRWFYKISLKENRFFSTNNNFNIFIVAKGIYNPEFKTILIGNNFYIEKKYNRSNTILNIEYKLSDKKQKDIIKKIPVNLLNQLKNN